MYVPEPFLETRLEPLQALISDHPFATLVTVDDGQPAVNHLPLLLRPGGAHGTLVGHVARANPVWRAFSGPHADARSATAVFHGPDAYVSPSWYPAKTRHHKVVPTWNYAVVHAEGRMRAIEDADWLLGLVRELTDRHEAPNALPWRVADAPPDFIATLLGQIVGIELTVTRLTGKWKLSQNRSAEDVAGVVHGLRLRGRGADDALAALMDLQRS